MALIPGLTADVAEDMTPQGRRDPLCIVGAFAIVMVAGIAALVHRQPASLRRQHSSPPYSARSIVTGRPAPTAVSMGIGGNGGRSRASTTDINLTMYT
jgi:hypothetical protein